jgi:hypothetical protein
VSSRLVAECQDALFALANLNEVTLIWVPGHHGILGNEEADMLARQASATPPHSPEPTLGIPKCLAREAIKNWTETNILSPGQKGQIANMASFFISRSCKKRAEDLLKLGRHQLKMIVAILTGHAPIKGHLRTIGLFDGDPSCRLCGMETVTVQHIICCCKALSRQRYVFGKPTVEPKE